jgi:hypothetical protein
MSGEYLQYVRIYSAKFINTALKYARWVEDK